MKKLLFIIFSLLFFVFILGDYSYASLNLDNENVQINNDKQNDTILFNEYLYLKKTKKDLKSLILNKNEDVIFKNKVVSTSNGFLGSYIDNLDEKYISLSYKEEKIERCPTFSEYEKNPKLYNKNTCLTDFDEVFTKEKVNMAMDFAKKIKYIYKIQDMELLAQILPYPVTINKYKNRNIIINTKEEFMKLNKDIILNKDIYNAIDSNQLFWNWQGFMLGNGLIWFWIDNEVSNVIINLS